MTKHEFYLKYGISPKDKFRLDIDRLISCEIDKSKKQPTKKFDKDRFEAMFRAVVANGGHELDHKQAIELTEEALKQLDAYYAEKEGGNNG